MTLLSIAWCSPDDDAGKLPWQAMWTCLCDTGEFGAVSGEVQNCICFSAAIKT